MNIKQVMITCLFACPLLQEMKVAFKARDPPLMLTAAVPATKGIIDAGYEIALIAQFVLFKTLLCYYVSLLYNSML